MPDDNPTPPVPAISPDAIQQTIDSQEAARKEFNDLLVALGATGQENLREGELARISYGYRRWLATKGPITLNFVKPKQCWYGVIQVPQPDGGVNVATFVSDQHPIELYAQFKLPRGAVLSFFGEITEEQFNDYNKALERQRLLV